MILVKHVKDAGLGGAFWYLGNEGKNGGLESEAKLFVQHAKAMKAVDPEIKCMFIQNHSSGFFCFLGFHFGSQESSFKSPVGFSQSQYFTTVPPGYLMVLTPVVFIQLA